MDNEQTSLELLFSLITEREAVTKTFTDQVAELIQPTVMTAVEEVLEVNKGDMTITHIDLYTNELQTTEQSALLITCMLSYTAEHLIPDLVQQISPVVQYDEDPLRRVVRVAIPLSFVFQDKQIIKDMLHHMLLTDISQGEIEEYEDQLDRELQEGSSNVVSMLEFHELQNKGKVH